MIDAVVDRFGEFVLFQPRARGVNLLLWLAGPLMAIIALLVSWRFIRSRSGKASQAAPLSSAERTRLEEIMRD